jgi:TonB family protein
MQNKNFLSMRNMGLLIAVTGMFVTGCHVNDTSSGDPSTSDTVVTMKMESSPVVTDTTTASNLAAADKMTSGGTGKMNPAKKGMKGKVAVADMPKMNGPMEADNTGTYSNVEVYPAFPGGSKGLQNFFNDNLQYPETAMNDGVDGKVDIMFTVDENGKLSNPQVMGDKLGYGLDEEALRVINKMPAWTPGKLKGKNVKTKFTLPVVFQLY